VLGSPRSPFLDNFRVADYPSRIVASALTRSQGYNDAQRMGLTAGTKLGPYEIVSPLGAGGMGEVYRARDTRLERDVAIKVLPAKLSSDLSLRQRGAGPAMKLHATPRKAAPAFAVLESWAPRAAPLGLFVTHESQAAAQPIFREWAQRNSPDE
jgi:serine/threonine protein kinase